MKSGIKPIPDVSSVGVKRTGRKLVHMRITTVTLGCLVLVAVLGAQPSPGSRKALGLIQAAQAKEAVQGDLKGAIELYRRAAREAGSDHATATSALLALAACYEKQGAAEARKVYEEILANYPDQKEAVAVARRKLGRSGDVRAGGPSVRQLWAGPDVDPEGGVSPDGRWLTYAHWETGDLGVRDLQNGTNRLLTNTGGYEKSGGQFAQDSIYSPDGKQIAYNFATKESEVRLMNADGSDVRLLFKKPNFVAPRAWSSDGKTIAVLHNDAEGMNSLFAVSVPSGEARQVLPPGRQAFWDMSFSPDGRWLALDMTADRSGLSDIYLLPMEGGAPVKLVENPANDGAPVWSADGKELYFISNRGGSDGLWRLPVSDGKASGPASLVKGDLGASIWPIGFTRSGSYVYGLDVGGMDIYEVDYDPDTGRITSKPRLISDRIPGRNRMPACSPDGRYLAWLRIVPHGRGSALVLRDLSSGNEQSYDLNTEVRGVAWSPDSSRIILDTRPADEPNTRTIVEFDLHTAQFSPLVKVQPTRGSLSPCFSKDGKTLFYVFQGLHVMAMDLETGQKRSLWNSPKALNCLRPAPDGRNLAILRNDNMSSRSLLTLPLDGGEPRVVASFKGSDDYMRNGLGFTPDGQSVIVRGKTGDGAGQGSDLLQIDMASGKVRSLGVSMSGIHIPDVHPSGRKIVFSTGDAKTEIWIAENILPPAKQ